MDLAELKFVVDTKELETAATRITELGTAVNKLNKPMQDLTKESAKNSKELSKAEEAAAKAALAQLKLEQAQTKSADTVGKSTSLLERHNLIVEYQAKGYSKGQASIMATAKASGALDGVLTELGNTLKLQRTLMGTDPFDKSIGLMQKLQNETRITSEVNNLFNKNLGLTEKQMIDLAREKERLIALYGIEGRDIKELAGEYDQLIRKTVEINKANDARTNSMRQQVKAESDSAKANAYLASEMDRVNRLTQSGGEMTSAVNNKLIKFEQALKLSGQTAAQQVVSLEKYKASLMSIQKASGNRQIDYLSRALGPQITDIAVGLATGQAPLTILLQQGGQLRDQFALAGVAGSEMGKMLVQASKAMISSVKDIGLAVGQLVVGAITGTGKAITNFGMEVTGTSKLLDLLRNRLIEVSSANSLLVKSFDIAGKAITMFTGIGAAAAISSLFMLGKGLYDVIKQQDQLTTQLVLSGASLGINATVANQYAQSLNAVGVNSSTALQVISAMAKEGGFLANEITMVTTAANNLKFAGVAIEDTVKQFAKLKEKPVEALIEVAKATGLVKPEVIALISELEQQGKTSQAAAIAMKAYADVTVQQKARLEEELSGFAIFMKTLSSEIADFFDSTFRALWRKSDPSTVIEEQIKAIDDILNNRAGVGGFIVSQTGLGEEYYKKQKAALVEQLMLIDQQKVSEITRNNDNIRTAKALGEWQQLSVKNLDSQKKAEMDIANIRKVGLQAKKSEAEIEKLIAAYKEKNKPAKTRTPAVGTDTFANALETANKFYQTQIGAVEDLTKSEIALNRVRESKEYKAFTVDQQKQIDAIYEQAKANELLVKSEKETQDALELKNKLLGVSDNLGAEYYKTIELINKYAREGKFGADEVLQLKAALEATTPEAKRLAAAQAENAKVMAGIAAERASVADQYGGDFRTADEKAAIKNLSDYRKKVAQADAELEKQLSTATEQTTYSEYMMYKEQAEAKKALAQDVYDREQYLLSDGYNRSKAQANAMENLFKGMGDAIVDFALTGKTSFEDMIKSMIVGLIKLEMQMAMTNMYKSAGGSQGIISALVSTFTGTPTPSAKGNVFDNGLQAFAKGGAFTNNIVRSPTMFNMGLMGEAGPEAIMPLRRGSDGSLGVVAAGASSANVSVQVINNSNAQATTNETVDSKGNRKIEVVIGDMTAGEISRSGSASQKSMRSTFGIQPQLIRR